MADPKPNITKQELSAWIKQRALDLGFMSVGFAEADVLTEEGRRLQDWLSKGYQGEMSYMANHFELRTDPAQLVPGTRSIICLSYNYHPEDDALSTTAPKIARYAYGRDYHKVVKKKMKLLLAELQTQSPGVEGRAFVDSAPVMEREWAKRAGLGWVGKNTLIIHPKKGSYFFLAVLLVNVTLDYDAPLSDHCGTCTRCIDACPTDAITQEGYVLNASECISYATIELKSPDLPPSISDNMEGWAFGCDICQEVCPWNKFSTPHDEPDFLPHPELPELTSEEWAGLTQEQFDKLFFGTPVKRTGYTGLKRNIDEAME